jgi:quinoprotein glucose dehydrogenase
VVSGQNTPPRQPYTTWSEYAGSPDSAQYSALKQINKLNVKKLTQVWFYPTPGPSGRYAFGPLVVDNMMYVLKPGGIFVALNASTGAEIWTHQVEGTPYDRGINYWESKDRKDRRLVYVANSYLQEINALTGITINTFGNDGRVDLREGLNRDPKTLTSVQTGTPGRIFENMIIPGMGTGEMFGAPPGYIRAFDVYTGKLLWTFHTVPLPGEYGYDTWPRDAWTRVGGVNTWGESTIDVKRGIGYFPLGSPTNDFYGADRVGQGLFGNCLLALDLRTGKRLWHFQEVHHDIWDYDPTTAPKLLTVRHNGKMVDVVAQPGKTGFLYVFDRVTGEPLWPIEERPVPASTIPGEVTWPTQPYPTKPPPFARQKLTADDINPYLDDADKERIRQILLKADTRGIFTPTSLEHDTIEMPGDDGGSNWSNAAVDPRAGLLFVRSSDSANLKKMRSQPGFPELANGTPEQMGGIVYIQRCFGCHGPDRNGVGNPRDIGTDRFKSVVTNGQGQMPGFRDLSPQNLDELAAYVSNPALGALPAAIGAQGASGRGATANNGDRLPWPEGLPRYFGSYQGYLLGATNLPSGPPPWTTLTAYDLNEGIIKWQVPLGSVPSLVAKGITNTGGLKFNLSSNHVGPVATGGGLVFIGSWSDRVLHAFDRDTGKALWELEIEANPEGIPAVYEVRGRQYVAFLGTGRVVNPAAGGTANAGANVTWKPGKPEAQGYYVFALPAGK